MTKFPAQLPHTPLILIVEDDSSTGEVLELAISQETSYRSLLVTSGQDALAVVQQTKPDLIILDYRLPDTTGIELYDQLQSYQDLKAVPVVLMSAMERSEELEPTATNRPVTRIDKPFELDDLLSTIERLLANATTSFPH
jgi:CheY-like chemotaxis protein